MANPTEISKEKALGKKDKADDPVKTGKKAIRTDKRINGPGKSTQQKERKEKTNAAKRRNEG